MCNKELIKIIDNLYSELLNLKKFNLPKKEMQDIVAILVNHIEKLRELAK